MLRRVALACMTVACLAPRAAQAAQDEPVVAASTPDGARLTVSDTPGAADAALLPGAVVDRFGFIRPDALCLSAVPPGRALGRNCSERPAPSVDDPVEPVEAFDRSGHWIGGAVPGAAATADIVLATETGTRTVRAQALDAAAYRGAFAGRVRFFLARLPADVTRLLRVRALDPSGAPIGFQGFFDDLQVGPRVSVGRGPLAGGGRWSVAAFLRDVTAPAAAAPERRERRLCLSLRMRTREQTIVTVTGWRDPGRRAAGLLLTLPDCDTRRTAVAALLPPAARRAALVLGDGSRLRLRVRRLPERLGTGELAAYRPVPAGQAVRAIRVDGRVRRLALPPPGVECGFAVEPPGRPQDRGGVPQRTDADGLDLFTPATSAVPGAAVLARIDVAGRPVELLGAAAADDVCVGLARPPRTPGDCKPPPLRARHPRLIGFRPAGRGPAALAVVTAPTVASAALLDVNSSGTRVVASTSTVTVGAGRAALLELPAGTSPRALRLLDAEGRALADVALPVVATGTTRTVARGKRWMAVATPVRTADAIPVGLPPVPGAVQSGLISVSGTCVQITRRIPLALGADCADQGVGQVDLAATCAPRLLHVYGPLGGGVRRVALVLAGGRRRAASTAHGAFHGVVRGREKLRRVELLSRAGRVNGTVRPRAPSPAAQCGYRASAIQNGQGPPAP